MKFISYVVVVSLNINYLNELDIDEYIQNDSDRFRLLCTNNFIPISKISKMIRELYDERRLILYK